MVVLITFFFLRPKMIDYSHSTRKRTIKGRYFDLSKNVFLNCLDNDSILTLRL